MTSPAGARRSPFRLRSRLRRTLRPRALHGKLVLVLLTSLGLGLAMAGAGTFLFLQAFLLGRVDTQLTHTAHFAEDYIAKALAAGQPMPTFNPAEIAGTNGTAGTAGTAGANGTAGTNRTSGTNGTANPGTATAAGADSVADNGWSAMSEAGLLPSYLEVRTADDTVARRVDPGGGTPALPADLAARIPAGKSWVFFEVGSSADPGGDPAFRVRASRLPGDAGVLVLAMPIDDVRRTLGRLGAIEATGWLVTFSVVGWVAARRIRSALRPLASIADDASAIRAGDLDRRVAPTDPDTEVGRLGIAVNTMLGNLESAFAERRASEERLRRFVADASHELRTPLTSIRGYAELFRRGAAERPEDLALAMARIESEAVRMGVLVDELLLLARLDSGRPLQREPVDLAVLAREAVADFRAAAPDRDIAMAGAEPVTVVGDADRLRQVLANLLANVRRHTPTKAGATLTVRSAGPAAVIEVADTGPGLTEEQCARVFERFYRADESRSRSADPSGGTGLGLSIVAAVAGAHGGTAEARPNPGGGTVVTVRLPLEGAPTREIAAADEPEAANHRASALDSAAASSRLTARSQPPHSAPASGPALLEGTDSTGSREATGAMEALSHFVVRHRRLVGLVWLAALIGGVFAASGLSARLDQGFAMPGQKGYVANQAILRQYGNGAGQEPLVPVVTLPAGSTVDDPAMLAALDKAFTDVGAAPGTRVAAYPGTHDRSFVSADGRTTFALVYPKLSGAGLQTDDVVNAAADGVAAVVAKGLPAGTTVHVTGTVPLTLGASSTTKSGPGVLVETLVGGVGALAVLVFVFASFLALVPLMVAAVSILTSFAVIFGLTEVMKVSSLVQFLVALIGLGVAIDYSLLLVTRWREERDHGHDNETAVHNAMATAGRAVAFSGVTVALGLIALVLLPVPFLRSMGIGGMVIPLVSVVVTLTLVPALLSGFGRRLDWPRLRKEGQPARGWTRWAQLVVRRRWVAAVAALAVLGFLGVNALSMQIGSPKSTSLSQSGPARAGLDSLTVAGVPSGVLTPIEVLVPEGGDAVRLAHSIAALPGVYATVAPTSWASPGSHLVDVLPAAETSTAGSRALVGHVRDLADRQAPGSLVGGPGAAQADLVKAVYGNFPMMLAVIAVVTFLLMARAFRSLLLPLKAVILNLLSVGAIYGVVTLVWQDGHGSQAIGGIPGTGAITGWIPLMVFAFLYGLSMDYEVFILARMREEYDRSGSTRQSVVEGIGRTGRLVTSAALILFLAFASLASGPEVPLKIFATALGAGILLDATVVRALLVPALVSLFGRWNWWLPGWAAKALRVPESPAHREGPVVEPVPELFSV